MSEAPGGRLEPTCLREGPGWQPFNIPKNDAAQDLLKQMTIRRTETLQEVLGQSDGSKYSSFEVSCNDDGQYHVKPGPYVGHIPLSESSVLHIRPKTRRDEPLRPVLTPGDEHDFTVMDFMYVFAVRRLDSVTAPDFSPFCLDRLENWLAEQMCVEVDELLRGGLLQGTRARRAPCDYLREEFDLDAQINESPETIILRRLDPIHCRFHERDTNCELNRRIKCALVKVRETPGTCREVRMHAEMLVYQYFGEVRDQLYDADLLMLENCKSAMPPHYEKAIGLANLVLADVSFGNPGGPMRGIAYLAPGWLILLRSMSALL